MSNPYDDDVSRFAVTYTRAIIEWNNAEDAARKILEAVSRGGIGSQAAILHLNSRTLKDAILTAVDMMLDRSHPLSAELAEHVCHFVDGLDVLRAYRNFFVHTLRAIGKSPDAGGEFRGLLHEREARGRYAWVQQELTISELEAFMIHTAQLSDYGVDIANYLSAPLTPYQSTPKPKPLSSLEKPTWPEMVKKNRQYLGAPQPPLKSSQASAREAKLARKDAQRRDPKNRKKGG